MHAASWKDCHLAWSQGLVDQASTVLLDHVCIRCSRNCNNVVSGSWVKMWWKYGARSEIEHGHCHIVADSSWKGGCICINDGTGRVGVAWLSSEVEYPSRIIWEDIECIKLRGRGEKLYVKGRVAGDIHGAC